MTPHRASEGSWCRKETFLRRFGGIEPETFLFWVLRSSTGPPLGC
jgi:hypothetical protein